MGPLVVATTTGPLGRDAQRWAAVLSAGAQSALCGLSALEAHGLRGWGRAEVVVRVSRGRAVAGPPWVRATTGRSPVRVVRRGGLPVVAVEDAAVGAAAASPSAAAAGGLLAAVVQQRLTTPARLRDAVLAAGPVRHRAELLAVLDDVEGGAQALSEVRLVRLCRSAGLPVPVQQAVRLDATGRRRYLDALWELDDGRCVLLEVDGVGHVEEGRWYDDLLRAAEVSRPAGGARDHVHLTPQRTAGARRPPRCLPPAAGAPAAGAASEGAVVASLDVRSVFQPVVRLGTGEVVGYEALARGSSANGPREPGDLFARARARDRVDELEWACRVAAVEGALEAGVEAPLVLFANVAPDVVTAAPSQSTRCSSAPVSACASSWS